MNKVELRIVRRIVVRRVVSGHCHSINGVELLPSIIAFISKNKGLLQALVFAAPGYLFCRQVKDDKAPNNRSENSPSHESSQTRGKHMADSELIIPWLGRNKLFYNFIHMLIVLNLSRVNTVSYPQALVADYCDIDGGIIRSRYDSRA